MRTLAGERHFRLTGGRHLRPTGAIVLVLALAGCATSATTTHHIAAPSPTSVVDPNGVACASLDSAGYCPGDNPSNPTAAAALACSTQLQQWLAGSTGDQLTNVGQVIQSVMNDAQSYNTYQATAGAQTFLMFVGDEVAYLASVPAMPSCADTSNEWPQWGLAANALGSDTAGTPQASSDYQALQSAWAVLSQEITSNGGTP